MKSYKDITEKEFYKKYGDYEIKFYSYYKDEFIFGTDEEDDGDIDLTVNIFDNNNTRKLHIYFSTKYKVSDLRDFIEYAKVFSKEKQRIIEIYDKDIQ